MMLLTLTLVLALLALTVVAVKRVPVGEVHSLYRHGKQRRLLQPGTHIVLPLLDRVGHRIDLGGRTLHVDASLAQTRPMHSTVYWQVLEPERADAVIEQADQLIRREVIQVLDNEADLAASDGRELAHRVKHNLNRHLRERGVMVTRVELEAA